VSLNHASKGQTGNAVLSRWRLIECRTTDDSLPENCSPESRMISGDDGWQCADNDGVSGADIIVERPTFMAFAA